MSAKKKPDPTAKALNEMAKALGDVSRRLDAVEKELARTTSYRHLLADQYRLEEKLFEVRQEGRRMLMAQYPPQKTWWQRWLEAMGLAAVTYAHTGVTMNSAVGNSFEVENLK